MCKYFGTEVQFVEGPSHWTVGRNQRYECLLAFPGSLCPAMSQAQALQRAGTETRPYNKRWADFAKKTLHTLLYLATKNLTYNTGCGKVLRIKFL